MPSQLREIGFLDVSRREHCDQDIVITGVSTVDSSLGRHSHGTVKFPRRCNGESATTDGAGRDWTGFIQQWVDTRPGFP